ncbi:hypothetical protein lacNasYZ03_00540 [Lactobacillus nasalidis]|uniref:EfeO-type cupredoxin-like domain-containing protein n=1 Tax=Lactobacillus nasalidis TaxID=2797258 RepID=A0ABQ3W852_9LACO|nr:cupredoxin domain-containing protein [Lactobacillus nasalidis]GHV97210.1 hypothetical protein lacNasYZ01_03920 [Lactobacillus nasalidis]GHW00151.1 hypothetical protein lacNasYZ02_15800 [Lactobacillus nasalidis]GHW00367.1 hypothetical protein lacNasYZ03_00540 [Lactobacillus nasalidis]
MALFKRKQKATIVVDKGYEPSEVHFKKGQPAQVNFKVKTDNACLEKVVFKDLGITEDLFASGAHTIEIPTEQAGEFAFSCGMDMFHGKVVIE